MKNGFPAEYISNGSVITVKTHEYGEEVVNQVPKHNLRINESVNLVS